MKYADKETVEATRQRIKDLVWPEMSEADLFWMRYEVGERYLMRMPIPYETFEALVRDKQFWNWFLSIWYLNDLKICKWFVEEKHIGQDHYEAVQEDLFKEYKINRAILAGARPPAAAKAK